MLLRDTSPQRSQLQKKLGCRFEFWNSTTTKPVASHSTGMHPTTLGTVVVVRGQERVETSYILLPKAGACKSNLCWLTPSYGSTTNSRSWTWGASTSPESLCCSFLDTGRSGSHPQFYHRLGHRAIILNDRAALLA
jgi:hypothetical protein